MAEHLARPAGSQRSKPPATFFYIFGRPVVCYLTKMSRGQPTPFRGHSQKTGNCWGRKKTLTLDISSSRQQRPLFFHRDQSGHFLRGPETISWAEQEVFFAGRVGRKCDGSWKNLTHTSHKIATFGRGKKTKVSGRGAVSSSSNISKDFQEFPRISKLFQTFKSILKVWGSLEILGNPRKSLEILGNPWKCQTKRRSRPDWNFSFCRRGQKWLVCAKCELDFSISHQIFGESGPQNTSVSAQEMFPGPRKKCPLWS